MYWYNLKISYSYKSSPPPNYYGYIYTYISVHFEGGVSFDIKAEN